MSLERAIEILALIEIAHRAHRFGDVQKYTRWLKANHYDVYAHNTNDCPYTLVLFRSVYNLRRYTQMIGE